MLLSNSEVSSINEFLAFLNTLFEKSKESGTVYLTMKRYSHPVVKAAKKNNETLDDDLEYPCIVRVACGKKKASTLVQPADLEEFNADYSNIARLHMDSLKKKDRKKKKN